MIKLFRQSILGLIFCTTAYAFDSTSSYNSANMAYPTNSTISQYVVLSSTQQGGGTFTFTVDAHAGGGRPLEHDTGNLRLEFYNSSGTMLGFSETSYSGNLLQMNAWSVGPGDNSEPWQTLTLTSTNCGSAGTCAGVAYVKVMMIGSDGSWWAGNYGPQWRAPSLSFNGGSNMLYNPEFGPYSGTLAQGWTSSTGWGACGTISGSQACTTTSAGVTVNMSGGGYDASGGTTSGTSGGYNTSLSSTNLTGSSGGTAPSFSGTITQTGAPATGNNYSSDPTTTGITTQQQNRVNNWQSRVLNGSNSVNLDVTGDSNQFTIDQVGSSNLITGIGTTKAKVQGNSNNVKINQGSPTSGQNEIDLSVVGDSNILDISQARTSTGTPTGTNNHYLSVDINGQNNTLTSQQNNAGGVGGHYAETTINGNQNSVITRQTDNGNKIMFTTVNGNNNSVDATQRGTGQHYLETKLTGNNNSALVVQEGTTGNKANIDLTNAGGASSIDLLQTGGKSFSIQQTCTTSGGCGTTVRQ